MNFKEYDSSSSTTPIPNIDLPLGFDHGTTQSLFSTDFLPLKMRWSPQTMLMTMKYDYKITHSVPIEVTP